MGLEVRVYGSVVVALYRITEYSELGRQRMVVQQWRIESYAKRGGVWTLISPIDSLIPEDPAVAKIDPKIYDAYVGEYEYVRGMTDTVTREGSRLMVQPAGQEKEEVFPENDTTYFAKGQGWRMIFVKDEQGQVTEVRFRMQGQDFRARKLK